MISPECNGGPSKRNQVSKRVTLASGRVVEVCFYCASGYEMVTPRPTIEDISRR